MNAINGTKQIIEKQVLKNDIFESGKIFGEYSKVYAGTNENIAGYMDKIDFQGCNKALSVMSSGDHVFNIALNGIKNIDTFDSNALTEFFVLGIKRSAIIAFNYSSYLKFINKITDPNISFEEISYLINYLLKYMDKKYREYWQTIIDFNNKLQRKNNTNINLFNLLLKDLFNLKETKKNAYLKNEENYNKLRFIIKDVNINFKCCYVTELSKNFKNKYDLIFLSNILDFLYCNPKYGESWKYKKLLEFEKNIMELLLSDGMVVLNYIYSYYYKQTNTYTKCLIRHSDITNNDLTDEKIISFPQIIFNDEQNDVDAAVLIKRN